MSDIKKTPKAGKPAPPPAGVEAGSTPTMRIPLALIDVDHTFNARSMIAIERLHEDSRKLLAKLRGVEGDKLNPKEVVYIGIAELAQDIKAHGQMTPAFVRPLPSGRYALVAGFRRCEAVRLGGGTHLEAKIEAGSDQEAYLLNLRENTFRDNLSPYDIAARSVVLRDKYGMTQAQIAKELGGAEGFSRSYVGNLLTAFDRLIPEFHSLWRQDKLTVDVAVKDVAPLSKEEQKEKLRVMLGLDPEPDGSPAGDAAVAAAAASGKSLRRAGDFDLAGALKAVDKDLILGKKEEVKEALIAALRFAQGKIKTLRLGQHMIYDPAAAKEAAKVAAKAERAKAKAAQKEGEEQESDGE